MKILYGLWALTIALFVVAQPNFAFAQSTGEDSDPGGGSETAEPNDRPDESDNGDPDVSDSDTGPDWSGGTSEPEPAGDDIDDSDVPGHESNSDSGTTPTTGGGGNDWDDSGASEIVLPRTDGDENFETTDVGR